MAPPLHAIHVHDHYLGVLILAARRLLGTDVAVVDFVLPEATDRRHFVQLGCGRVLINHVRRL